MSNTTVLAKTKPATAEYRYSHVYVSSTQTHEPEVNHLATILKGHGVNTAKYFDLRWGPLTSQGGSGC